METETETVSKETWAREFLRGAVARESYEDLLGERINEAVRFCGDKEKLLDRVSRATKEAVRRTVLEIADTISVQGRDEKAMDSVLGMKTEKEFFTEVVVLPFLFPGLFSGARRPHFNTVLIGVERNTLF